MVVAARQHEHAIEFRPVAIAAADAPISEDANNLDAPILAQLPGVGLLLVDRSQVFRLFIGRDAAVDICAFRFTSAQVFHSGSFSIPPVQKFSSAVP